MAKNIPLQHYDDGTPSVLRKKTVYGDLFFYRKSDTMVQLTKSFCDRFLPKYGDRTVDQMNQAARSIKQNIAEGLTDGQTSFEVEIKLLGIAKGSNQELLEDYQDYLKHHHLPDWGRQAARGGSKKAGDYSNASVSRGASFSRGASVSGGASFSREASFSRGDSNSGGALIAGRYEKMVRFCREHNDLADYEPFFSRWTDEEMCNTAICLCHMIDRAMTTFIAQRDREFVEEGGIRERMTAARLDMRGTQKQIIAQLEAENARLRAQVASLQHELELAKKID